MMEDDKSDNPPKVIIPHVWFGHQSSSHIPFIRASLKTQIDHLSLLSIEIDSFAGVSENEKDELRQNLLKQYAPHDSHVRVSELAAFVDDQVEVLTKEKSAFLRKFSTPFMNLAIPIVLLSSALSEALINSMVATGFIMAGRSELFSLFDRMEIREKWRLGPRLISDTIKVDTGNHLFGRLKELVDLRNAFTHCKIDITSSDSVARIKGTSHRKILINSHGRKLLIGFGSLPDALFDLIVDSISDHSVRFPLAASSFRFSV